MKVKKGWRRIPIDKPLKRPIPYILLVLGLLIYLFSSSISSYTENAFGKILVQIIENEFDDKYIVEYRDIRYNIFRNRINVKDFSVYTDSTTLNTNETSFKLNSSSFLINFKSLFELLFKKTLTVQRINVVEPYITIIDNSEPDSTTLRQEIDPDKAIQSALEQMSFLKINALNIEKATLKILEPTDYTHIGNLSVSIENMGIGHSGESGERYDLNSTEFELIIEDEEFEFGNYKLVIDKLRISKNDSLMSLEGIRLGSTIKGNEETADLELVELTGLDVLSVLTESEIDADKFFVKSGKFDVDLTNNVSNSDTLRFQEIVKADTLEFRNIDLKARIEFKGKLDTVQLNNASLVITPFEVSRRILNDPMLVFAEANVMLNIEEYESDISFYKHRMIGKSLTFNTAENKVSLGDFRMYPIENRSNYINNHVTDFSIYGLQSERLFLEKELIFDSIEVNFPKIEFSYSNPAPIEGIIPDDSLLLTDVDPAPWARSFLKYGHAQKAKLNIDTLSFDVNQSAGSLFDLKTVTYNIDFDTSKINLPYALYESIIMDFSRGNVSLNNNDTRIRLRRFAKRLNEIQLSNISYTAKLPNGSYDAASENVVISGDQLFKSFIKGHVEIDRLQIDRPVIRVSDAVPNRKNRTSKVQNNKDPILDTLLIGGVDVRDGSVVYNRKGSNANVELFDVEMGQVKYLPERTSDVQIKNLLLNMKGIQATENNDSLLVNSLSFSSADSLININRINITMKGESQNLKVLVPEYKLSGVDFNYFLRSNNLSIGNQKVKNPEITITQHSPGNKQKSVEDTFSTSFDFFTSRILLENGNFTFNSFQNEDSIRYLIPNFNSTIENIDIRKNRKNDINRLISKINLLTGPSSIQGIKDIDTLNFGRMALVPNEGVFINDIQLSSFTDERDIQATIKSLSLVDDELLKYINEPLKLSEFNVYQPIIHIRTKGDQFFNAGSSSEEKSENLEISQINMRNAEFYLDDEIKVKNADLTILGYRNNRDKSEQHIYNADNVQARIGNASYRFPSGLNEISIKDFIFSSMDGSGTIKGITHTPLHAKMEYGYVVGLQTDWITLTTGDLNIEGFDLFRFVQDREIIVSQLEINDVDMLIFRDKHIPFNEEQRRFLPQTILRKIQLPINISKIKLESSTVTYEELAENLDTPGRVFFENLSGSLNNFTNMDSAIDEDPHFIVNASTNIIGEGLLEANFDFRLDSLNDYFTLKAHMGEMDLRKFNTMMEKNYNVLIKSGQADELTFEAQATNDVSWGSMDFFYHDFKINVIGKQNFDTKGVGPGFLTFFANSFVINTNNPHLLRKRDGDIYSERDKRRSVFNYLARLSLSGIISSIGAKNNRKEIKRMYKQQEEERKRREKEEKNSTKKNTQNEKLNRK